MILFVSFRSWVKRHGLLIAWILLAFEVQYLLFGNFGKTDIQTDGIRNMEGRLADFDMAMSTLKRQHMNDKDIFHDMVEKFKNEMKNKDETKLKELTSKLNGLEEAKEILEDKYKEIEKTFQSKIKNMESTFNDKISAVDKFVKEFEQTFSNYETSLQTFVIKTERKMHEMTKKIEDKSTRIKEQVEDFSKDFDQKLKMFKGAKSDLDNILVAVRKDVDTIKPNTFNKGSYVILILYYLCRNH
jgi:uncharacterized phage infection (PIP) family protein YhgE